MKHLVIDLEMCRVPRAYRSKNYKYANETIQIGAVLLDEEFRKIGTYTDYVHPEHGVVDTFITELTGILPADVKHAPLLADALERMIDRIGSRDYKIYAWSRTDREQLLHEVKAKSIESVRIAEFLKEERWVDYQQVFSERFEFFRPVALHEALDMAEIDTEGRLHDGLCDAVNTGYLIEKLEMDPEFCIAGWEAKLERQELGCSLGEVFARLGLQIA